VVFTDEEKKTIKDAAYGAVALVSNADPGLLDVVREGFAASKELAGTAGEVREALTGGGLPELIRVPVARLEDLAELEVRVLPLLREAVAILEAKAPIEAEVYRATVLAACARTAAAVGGVKPPEGAAIDKVRAALGA
jgi:hypothetical protein